ncbi:MAG: AraC family transcriptional regulator [Marinobacter sp.]|nr:AraC family transcriptional regulator [Marinobacter sp.]
MLNGSPHTLTASELPGWTRQPNQPVTYPRVFVASAVELGADRSAILQHAAVPAETLDDPAGRISYLQTLQLFEAVHAAIGDTALGFDTGLRLPLTAHGNLGYALMCAPTPREAISILERFWHLRGRGVLMTVKESETDLFFEIEPEVPIPVPLREMKFSSILTSMIRGMEFVLPMLPNDREIWLCGPEPGGYSSRKQQVPCARFNMPRAGVVLGGDRSWLDQPLPTANPEGLAQALAQCERESALTETDNDIARQVRAHLVLGQNGYPSPEQLAENLCLTPRTLRRRLHEQGLSYKQLLDDVRRRDSCQLLASSELEIQSISEVLGFADPANFTRAFKNWTGVAPREWRRGNPRVPGGT